MVPLLEIKRDCETERGMLGLRGKTVLTLSAHSSAASLYETRLSAASDWKGTASVCLHPPRMWGRSAFSVRVE